MPDDSKAEAIREEDIKNSETFLPSDSCNAQLRFDNWGYRHATRKHFAVRGLNLTIEAGQKVLLLGASGIGKSTILAGAAGIIGSNVILSSEKSEESEESIKSKESEESIESKESNGMIPVEDEDGGISEGCVYVDDIPVRQAIGKVGLVLQDPDSQAIFQRLGDNVAFGLENMNVPHELIWQQVNESLKKVGLEGLQLHRSTSHLSGGQQQRLALAGALAMKPSILLLDEPTANLDPNGVNQVVKAVKNVLDSTHSTMLLVEHHAEPWIDMIDRVVVLGLDEDISESESLEEVHDDDIARSSFARTIIVADGTPDEVFNRSDLDFTDLGIWLPSRYKKSDDISYKLDYDSSNANGDVILSTKDLSISHTDKPIAEHINLEFKSGQITALVGANGAGKSTLSLTLAGLLPALSGSVVASDKLSNGLNGTDPIKWKSSQLAKRISYVFQNPEHQFACGTVLQEVMLGPLRTGMSDEDARKQAESLLKRFSLLQYADSNPYTLSGGEKRRLTVAASLAAAPSVIILDEPTFGQDRKTWLQIINLIESLHKDGICIIVVTHDKELVNALGARVIELCAENSSCDSRNSDSDSDNSDFDSDSDSDSFKDELSSSASNTSKISVSDVNLRSENPRKSSYSPLLASMNPVYRMIGAFLCSIPLLFTLDCVSASCALALEFIIFACIKIPPWKVAYLSWPVWIGAPMSALTVLLYGKSGGNTWFQWGMIHVTDRSSSLALATFLRILAIGIPSIVTVIGIDATDLADAFSQILHFSDRFVYGGLAGIRMFNVLQDDWRALSASRRSRGIGDGNKLKAFFPQMFALLVLSIRRSTTLAVAMEARGFGGFNPRSHARISKVKVSDWILIIVCVIIPLISLAVSIYTGSFALFGGSN